MPELDFQAPRLFVDAPLGTGEKVMLEPNQSNYLGNVLRLSAGGQAPQFTAIKFVFCPPLIVPPPAIVQL